MQAGIGNTGESLIGACKPLTKNIGVLVRLPLKFLFPFPRFFHPCNPLDNSAEF